MYHREGAEIEFECQLAETHLVKAENIQKIQLNSFLCSSHGAIEHLAIIAVGMEGSRRRENVSVLWKYLQHKGIFCLVFGFWILNLHVVDNCSLGHGGITVGTALVISLVMKQHFTAICKTFDTTNHSILLDKSILILAFTFLTRI